MNEQDRIKRNEYLCQLYLKGKVPQELARRFNLSHRGVTYVLQRMGIFEEGRRWQRHPPISLPEAEVCHLYDGGASQKDLEARFKVRFELIWEVLKHAGRRLESPSVRKKGEVPSYFWSLVGPPSETGCREWGGLIWPSLGYGRVSHPNLRKYGLGRANYAHRVAWVLTNGEIPKGFQINHHCDNRLCCEPLHLYVGTQQQNMNDREARLSPERKKRRTAAQQSPSARKKHRATLNRPEVKAKMSASQKIAQNRPEVKTKKRAALKKYFEWKKSQLQPTWMKT